MEMRPWLVAAIDDGVLLEKLAHQRGEDVPVLTPIVRHKIFFPQFQN
jgi:hypothetical protein